MKKNARWSLGVLTIAVDKRVDWSPDSLLQLINSEVFELLTPGSPSQMPNLTPSLSLTVQLTFITYTIYIGVKFEM